jgi:hypothetical protein
MLTDDGLLRKRDGTGERLTIIGPDGSVFGFIAGLFRKAVGMAEEGTGDSAYYKGALPYKAFRHRLQKNKEKLQPDEYRVLAKIAQDNIVLEGDHDVISIFGGIHDGVLAHETFHDIQGFLYDNYPDTVDALHSAILSNRQRIIDFYLTPNNSGHVSNSYTLTNFFPGSTADAPSSRLAFLEGAGQPRLFDILCKGYGAALRKKEIKTPSGIMTVVAMQLINESEMDVGRNEVIPVLLSAASEGNSEAAAILADVFAAAGLNDAFARTLPRVDGLITPTVERSIMAKRFQSRPTKWVLLCMFLLYGVALVSALLFRLTCPP